MRFESKNSLREANLAEAPAYGPVTFSGKVSSTFWRILAQKPQYIANWRNLTQRNLWASNICKELHLLTPHAHNSKIPVAEAAIRRIGDAQSV